MSDPVVFRMIQMLHDEVAAGELGFWYLSFVGDEGFRGAVVVRAFGLTDAISQSHLKGINPGGDVRAAKWPDHVPVPPPEKRDRLLTAEEARNL